MINIINTFEPYCENCLCMNVYVDVSQNDNKTVYICVGCKNKEFCEGIEKKIKEKNDE